MEIKHIFVSGFKSIEKVELNDISAFTVFAGANGSGKSNFFDSICFVSKVIKVGAYDAIRSEGGYGLMHCFKKNGTGARIFRFSITVELDGVEWKYDLEVKKMDAAPSLTESLHKDGVIYFKRKEGEPPRFGENKTLPEMPSYPRDRSALMFAFETPIFRWLSNIKVFRIDPIGAKEPDSAKADNSELDSRGQNVASVLSACEKDEDFRELILEWMEMVVPGLTKVSSEHLKLEGRTALKFKEEGTKAQFPANLISDGTIYVLCILTAIITRKGSSGITLIEEPERGINPKAIAQIVELMREYSSNEHPIWVTTHNETLVRSSDSSELILTNKIDGRTVFKLARNASDSVGDMPLDKAWLSNLFGGGLPW